MQETMIPAVSSETAIPTPVAPPSELPDTNTLFITTRIFDILVEQFNTHVTKLADEHYDATVEDILAGCRDRFILHDEATLSIVNLAFDNCVDEADFRETLEAELDIVE